MEQKAVFLDRDGVINYDYGYVHKKENFVFLPGIFELVKAAKKLNYLVIVITNQSGIGRGLYSNYDFDHLMQWVKDEFLKNGGSIDAVYFCPHHPIHGIGKYKINCLCRKPNAGMLEAASLDYLIDRKKSIFVGDKLSDMSAALEAGIGNLIYLSNGDICEIAHQNVVSLYEIIDSLD